MDFRSAFQLENDIVDRVRSEVENITIKPETDKAAADQAWKRTSEWFNQYVRG